MMYGLRYRNKKNSRYHWRIFIYKILPAVFGPGVDSASNRNEYQEYFLRGKGSRCVGLTTLSPLCVDCLEISKPQPPGNLRACPGLYKGYFTSQICGWISED